MKRIRKPIILPKKTGPKSLWNDSLYNLVRNLCILGLTDKELAAPLGVKPATIDYWKNQHPMFLKALREGRTIANSNVAVALYKRAIGYSHPDVHIISNRVNEYDSDGKIIKSYIEPLLVPIIKHYPPDGRSASFLLKNRTRGQESPWSDRLELTGKLGGPIDIKNIAELDLTDFTTDELKVLQKMSNKLHLNVNEHQAN